MIPRAWKRILNRDPAIAAPLSIPSNPTKDPAVYDLGLRDAMEAGWYKNDTGELLTGFPIVEEDVVLDAGCGDGRNALFCARRGARVIGADIDPGRLALASQRLAASDKGSFTPIVSACDPLPLEDGIATKIIASEVIEHVDDPVQFLAELVRVGRSGSLYLLTAPDPVSEGLQKQLAPPIYFQKPNHVRIIKRAEFRRLVTDAGLSIEDTGSHGFYSAMSMAFFWSCRADLQKPQPPLLRNWENTWRALLETEDGRRVKKALDDMLPNSQYIVARKP